MAGGAGTRFWPASRKARPKPFLDLLGRGPLIEVTAARMEPLVSAPGIVLVLGEHLEEIACEVMPEAWTAKRLVEPVARNTLGAVLLAMVYVRSLDED